MSPPLLKGWLAVCGLKREAAIWGGRAVVGGGRSDLLAQRLEAAIAAERPVGLISFGVAGALHPALSVGTIVLGAAVVTGESRWRCDRRTTDQLVERLSSVSLLTSTSVTRGRAFGSDAVAHDPATKAALAGSATIIDMESHVAARAAKTHGLALAVLRIVSDEARHPLPPAALVAMAPDGGVDLTAVLLSLARRPSQIGRLIRLGRGSGRAFRLLAAAREALD